jgi:hypothetical protein
MLSVSVHISFLLRSCTVLTCTGTVPLSVIFAGPLRNPRTTADLQATVLYITVRALLLTGDLERSRLLWLLFSLSGSVSMSITILLRLLLIA